MEKQKILVLLYQDCVAFELTVATHLLHNAFEIVTVAPTQGPLPEWGGLILDTHHRISEVNVEEFAALIIPGGKWEALLQTPAVVELIQQAVEHDLVIGAICAAPVHLANAGVLQGRKYTTTLSAKETDLFAWEDYLEESVVVDGKFVTAKGNAFIDFAVELADLLQLFESPEQKESYRKYFKNIQ